MGVGWIELKDLKINIHSDLEAGFTLVELLVAIFIFSIVISSVYGAYRATFKVIQGAEAQLVSSNSARIVLGRLTDDLQSIVVGTGGGLRGESHDISGTRADSIGFVSSVHLRLDKGDSVYGRSYIHYTVEPDDDNGTLSLYRSDIGLTPGVDPLENEDNGYLIGVGLTEVRFSYSDEDGGEVDEWSADFEAEDDQDQQGLPRVIYISLTYGDDVDNKTGDVYKTAVTLPAQGKKE